jgi:hypothetical protein
MILLPGQQRQASAGLENIMMAFDRWFGRWAPAAWILSGILGFAALMFSIDMAHLPQDGGEWTLAVIFLVICLATGPSVLVSLPFVIAFFVVCSWLMP